jgi:Glycosyl transferases group 1
LPPELPAVGSPDRLDDNYAGFRDLLATARRRYEDGRLDAAAAYCQIAGMAAWTNPVGLFGSDEIEDLLRALSRRLPACAPPEPRPAPPRTVLHVATQVYQTGGSTQAIAAWIEQDAGRRHRVCVTRQGASELPAKILARLTSRSDLVRLDTKPRGLMGRAAALREAAADTDVVVLHAHPCDVLPVIAFGDGLELPPVVYVDHADHVFWLGRSVARVLLSMRDSGRLLALSRRGIEAERCVVMARPLRLSKRSVQREEAKRRLGLPVDQVVIVTAADGSKYQPIGGPAFLDLVRPVIARHADVSLRAAGPAPDGEWALAARATAGRIRALGTLPDVSLLQQAADIYLDSFPFSSLTSLLEAGSYGTPVVTFRGHPDDCLVLGADTRGLDEHMLCPASAEAFEHELGRLIAQPDLRRELGERTRRAILDSHSGAGWQASVTGLYERAVLLNSAPQPGHAERRAGRLDVLVDHVMEQTGFGQGVPGAVRANLGLLPPRERIDAWRELVSAGAAPERGQVVPDWLRGPLASVRRRAGAVAAVIRDGRGPFRRALSGAS